MNKSKLDLPHIKLLIAHGVANGHSQREIAEVKHKSTFYITDYKTCRFTCAYS